MKFNKSSFFNAKTVKKSLLRFITATKRESHAKHKGVYHDCGILRQTTSEVTCPCVPRQRNAREICEALGGEE